MKRTYLKGCDWCNATGYTQMYFPPYNTPVSTTTLTNVCPVCKGSGTVLVTEEIEDEDPSH